MSVLFARVLGVTLVGSGVEERLALSERNVDNGRGKVWENLEGEVDDAGLKLGAEGQERVCAAVDLEDEYI